MKMTFLKIFLWSIVYLMPQIDKYKMADKLYNEKQYDASVKICSSELRTFSQRDSLFEKFLALRADSYRELHKYKLGIEDYLTLIKVKPQKTEYYVGLSYMYWQISDVKNSLNTLKKAITLDPKNVFVLNNLSYYSGQMGDFINAVKYASIGLKYAASDWQGSLLNNRGYGYIGLGKYEEALSDINAAIKVDPGNSLAYCYRAIANIHLKHMETVCADLQKAKEMGAVNLTSDLIKANCKN